MFTSFPVRLIVLLLGFLATTSMIRLVCAQETLPLVLGQAVKRDLQGGQTQAYRVTLGSKQFVNLAVEQQGIDVEVVVADANGKPLLKVNSRKQGTEALSFVSEADGTYQILVQAPEAKAPAGAYIITLHALRPATLSDQALVDAFKLSLAALVFSAQQKPAEAAAAEETALARLAQQFGEDLSSLNSLPHNVVEWYAALLTKQGLRAEDKGDYGSAEAAYQRAHRWLEHKFGRDDAKTLEAITNLGVVAYQKGEYLTAARRLETVLDVQQRTLAADSAALAGSRANLAAILFRAGDYVSAEQLYQQAKTVWEQRNDANTFQAWNGLAIIQLERGDYEQAETLWQKVLAVFPAEQASADKATILCNIAALFYRKGDDAQAERYESLALAMRKQALAPEHQDVGISLNHLGDIYARQGDATKAQAHYLQALTLLRKTVGAEHQNVAYSLRGLGLVAQTKGDYAQAENYSQDALKQRQKLLGATHPEVSETLGDLALLYRHSGAAQKALPYQTQANAINETNLRRNLVVGSERQKLGYLALFSAAVNTTLDLHAQGLPNSNEAAKLALEMALRSKGRALDAMADSIATLRRHANTEQQKLFDQLLVAQSRLANLTVRGLGAEKPETYRAQLKQSADEIEQLEAELSRRSAAFTSQWQPVTLAAIRAALPRQTSLLEFATYQPYQAATKTFAPPRYLAYLLNAEGALQWKDLGAVSALDLAIEALRAALRDPLRKDIKPLARQVDAQVMQPLRALLGDTKHLLISPDGMLNLLPFAALVDEQNQYLLENYTISYLTSGRDLLRLQVARAPKSGPLIVADPDFDLLPQAKAVARAERRSPGRRATLRGVNRGDEDITQWTAERLSETTREAAGIKAVLPQAKVLLRQDATKAALKQLAAPSILHIATHGFFLPDAKAAKVTSDNTRGLSGAATNSGMLLSNDPLLRSGLLLAGFNQHKSGEANGVLTAKEVAGLDLWGTELVVLSACNTGLGEVKNGEGVYGLRRALVLAGAKTQVMSLWPVDEVATREWMTAYYAALQKGLGRGAALRQVQLQLLQQKHRQHPFYWASFIQSGEWATLTGQR
jgi:CHAT domain-containing protein/tetratricopeptide (TPR) repeat protein